MNFIAVGTILTILVSVSAANIESPNRKVHRGNQYIIEKGLRGPFWQVIFPGTKWCGTGSIAENENDLGSAVEADKCCRTHDFCDDIMLAQETKHNLTNHADYTRLNCKCDYAFLECLQKSGDRTSFLVGWTYFTSLRTQCFKLEYPIVRCKKHHWFPRTCQEYELDTTTNKLYQWFDVPHW